MNRHPLIVAVVAGILGMTGVQASGWAQIPEAVGEDGTPTDALSSETAPRGALYVDISDVLGVNIPSKVELHTQYRAEPIRIRVPKGKGTWPCPVGQYSAHSYIYDGEIPILIDIQNIVIAEGRPADLVVNLVEGVGGNLGPRAFDGDYDLVMDRVEIEQGTNPADPASYPAGEPIPFDSPVLAPGEGWYRGELHARSKYGGGSETVAELVKRAEDAKLDFLAITDRNTMAACQDPAFQSEKVVLIPALEWGSEDWGVALVYGPRTLPEASEMAGSLSDAQGVNQRVQAQGGVFGIAHPCFPTAPWQWGLSYVNVIEVWCREWRGVPPLALEQLDEEYRARTRSEGRLVYSIAHAVETPGLSANGQGAKFWDYELVRGLKAGPIAGSLSSSPEVPLGRPLTYVYAPEKSVSGILAGLRQGRTMVSSGPDGPEIYLSADVSGDGTIDVGVGGIVPLDVDVDLVVEVRKGKGKKVQILRNGHLLVSQSIELKKDKQAFVVRQREHPVAYTVYRARVVATAEEPGFGDVEVCAMSAPIYAQQLIVMDREKQSDPGLAWIELKSKVPSATYVTGMLQEDGKKFVIYNPNERPVVQLDQEGTWEPSAHGAPTEVPRF